MAEKSPIILKLFNGGWVSEIKSDSLEINMSPDLENVDFSASGSVKKTWGYEELGSDEEDAINTRLMIVPDRQGIQYLIKKCGTKLKIYDSTFERYDTILTGLTDGDTPVVEYFDATAYIMSAVDPAYKLDLYKNTRLTAATEAADAVVNVDDTTNFTASGTFWLNSTLFTYTGKTGTSFTGCTDTPAAEDNSFVFSPAVNVGGANEIPKGIITAQYVGRLFVANGSTIYGSKLNDLSNFTVTGSGAGDAIQKTVESKINALKVFYDDQNNLRLLSFTADNKIYVHDVLDDADLSATIMTSSMFKDNVTAVNQLSTLVGPNNLYHVDFRNQLRSLGQTYASRGVNKVYSDSMSKFHESLFKNYYDFDDARAVIYGNEYWMVTKEGTGDINNRLIVFDFEAGNWRKRTGINSNDIAVFNDDIIFADATRNKVFKFSEDLMADDDESIYFKYSTLDVDLEKLRFERVRRVRIAGFMSVNCESTAKIMTDFATKTLATFTLRGDNTNITGSVLGKDGTFGGMVFGDQVIGGESSGLDIRFFIADLELNSLPDLENFRIVLENNQSNVYFEITAIKPFIMQMAEDYWPINKILSSN